MSDINLGNMSGLIALVWAWGAALVFAVLAAAFVIASLSTGKRSLFGPRILLSFAFALGSFVGGYSLKLLSDETRQTLDERFAPYCVGMVVLGAALCFRVGKR